ncbi:hypothetical protein M3Y97_00870000 [Aphelenchoides bicaudatus]|nr:hypothetical protein M3Y97_00870000 [Aphelenchoides bicaudatus]
MVTRGYGSIDEERMRASFSVPIYYFKNCETWTFFTTPTQVGMPYSGKPPTRMMCNVTNLCVAPKIPHSFKAYPDQSSTPTTFSDQPIDADIDIKGGLHVNKDQNNNIRFSPQQQQQNDYNYDQQYGYGQSTNGRNQFTQFDQNNQYGQQQYGQQQYGQQQYGQQQYGQQQYGQQQYGQQQPGYSASYYNPSGYFNNNGNPANNQGFYDTRYPNSNSQNMSAFTIDNPNYKFLPDGLGNQYDANSGRQRFYDNNGNPTANNQFGANEDPLRSNSDQNRLNYQDINGRGNPQTSNNQYTNNIYGYDYRSNPGNKYTINGNFDINVQQVPRTSGNEQQYQPPQNQYYSNGRRKKRQTGGFQGTSYQGQDNKFPRVENTVQSSGAARDDPTPNFNTGSNNFNSQRAFYDSQNSQGGMYYPIFD